MPCCVRSMNLIGLRIFFKYNAGDSFKMDIPFGNKELFGNFIKIIFLFFSVLAIFGILLQRPWVACWDLDLVLA